MAKKSIRYMRLILTGIIWALLYLDLSRRLFYGLWEFDTLSSTDWKERISAFLESRWIIDTGRDWGLMIGMILFIPVFLLGWFLAYHINWGRLFRKRHSSNSAPKSSFQIASVKRVFEPAKLRVQSSAVLSVPVGNIPQQQSQIPNEAVAENIGVIPSTMPPPTTTQPTTPMGGAPQPAFEDEEDVRRMLAMTAGIKADFFPHVNLDGHYASFALSTEKQAVVVRLINRPDSVWAVDTEVPPAESDWFDQTSLLPAPVKDVAAIAQNLRDNEPNSSAVPVVLLMSGRLLNIDETLTYFENNNIMLLRLPEAEADEIPLFEDFINEYFKVQTEAVEQG